MGGSVYIRYPNEGDILINESIIINWDISNVRETGEEVLNRHGDVKLFKHLDNTIDVLGFSEESVEEIQQ